MSDKEAYELLVKYSGGEHTMTRIREMIHIAGLQGAVDNTVSVYEAKGKVLPEDFKAWIYQSFRYVQQQMLENMN